MPFTVKKEKNLPGTSLHSCRRFAAACSIPTNGRITSSFYVVFVFVFASHGVVLSKKDLPWSSSPRGRPFMELNRPPRKEPKETRRGGWDGSNDVAKRGVAIESRFIRVEEEAGLCEERPDTPQSNM